MSVTVSEAAADGEVIPGYRILELLASGGMGGVYLAEDENLKRRAAIKFIRSEFTSNPDYVERFTREAVIVAAFQHANIVTVYASGWTGEKQYIVMEYLPGGALSERINREPLPASAAARISFQMADALAYAHERDVIHRDFKPANILLRENGTPVLSDFGIAKSEIARTSETTVGVVMGNMRYMAPEQALGQVITDRVDVYCLGLVFHEMLAGELPRRHPLRNKQDAQTLVRALGSEYGELIARCLSAEPELRPSAKECRDWLGVRVNRQKSLGSKRRPALLAGAAVTILAVSVGGVLAWRGFGGLERVPIAPGAAPAVSSTAAGAGAGQVANAAAGQRWTVQRVPASASIFIDGDKLDAPNVDLSEGDHQFVAVAHGYYGEVRQVTARAGQAPQTLSVGLEPTTLPSSAEEQRFLKLADAKTVTVADVDATVDPTFRTVLRAKLLGQTGQAEALAKLTREVDTLQKMGDSRAAVAALLMGAVQTGRLGRSQVTQSLIDASDGGDAMASLFLAVAYREAINASGAAVAASDARFHSYCQRMQLAATQGWEDIASEYWRRDRCTG